MSAPTPPALEIHSGIVLKGQLSMVKDVILTGKFEGELQTLGCLTVLAGVPVTGSIEAGALVLEPGNLLNAQVKVSSPPPRPSTSFEMVKKIGSAKWSLGLKKVKDMVLRRK